MTEPESVSGLLCYCPRAVKSGSEHRKGRKCARWQLGEAKFLSFLSGALLDAKERIVQLARVVISPSFAP
jgi:hypothetical protein